MKHSFVRVHHPKFVCPNPPPGATGKQANGPKGNDVDTQISRSKLMQNYPAMRLIRPTDFQYSKYQLCNATLGGAWRSMIDT